MKTKGNSRNPKWYFYNNCTSVICEWSFTCVHALAVCDARAATSFHLTMDQKGKFIKF